MSDLVLRQYGNQSPLGIKLNGGIDASQLTMTLTGTAGFPGVPFTVECENEVMLVTNITGFVATIERAYDGSLPGIHPDTADVEHVLTADDFNHQPRTVTYSPPFGDEDVEFDDATDGLTDVTIGTADWTVANGTLSGVISGQATNEVFGKIKSIASLPIGSGVQTAVRVMATDDFIKAGPILASGFTTTDDIAWQHMSLGLTTLTADVRSGTFAVASTSDFSNSFESSVDRIHMRLIWVAVNQFRAWWSVDGVGWTDFGEGIQTITDVNPPTYFGVGVSAWGGSGDKLASFDYIRIVSF